MPEMNAAMFVTSTAPDDMLASKPLMHIRTMPEVKPFMFANDVDVYAEMRSEPLPLEQMNHDGGSSKFRRRRHISSRSVSDTRRRSASCLRKHLGSVTSEHVHVETKVYRGVRMRSWGKWVSEIRQPKKRSRIWLGSYSTPEAAAKAYDMALYCLRGPLAALNFPASIPSEDPPADLSPRTVQKAAIRAGQAADREQSSGNHKEVELRDSTSTEDPALHACTIEVLDNLLQVNSCEVQASAATVSSHWDLDASPKGLRVRRQVSTAASPAIVFQSLTSAESGDQQKDHLTDQAMRHWQTAMSAGIWASRSSTHQVSARRSIPADRSRPRRVINLNEKAPAEGSSDEENSGEDGSL